MRALLCLLIAASLCSSQDVNRRGMMKLVTASADPAFVSSNGASYDPFGTSRTIALTGVTTGANIVVAMYGDPTNTISSCTDNQSNTYTVDNGTRVKNCYAYNVTGSATLTITVTLADSWGNPGQLIAAEYSGSLTARDQTCEVNASFTTNVSCTTGSISVVPQVVIGIMFNNQTKTAGDGFTLRQTVGNLGYMDKITSATGTQLINFVHATETTTSLRGLTIQ